MFFHMFLVTRLYVDAVGSKLTLSAKQKFLDWWYHTSMSTY